MVEVIKLFIIWLNFSKERGSRYFTSGDARGGCNLQVAGCRLQVAGCRLQVTLVL